MAGISSRPGMPGRTVAMPGTAANACVDSGNGYFGRSAAQTPGIQIGSAECPQPGTRDAYVYRKGSILVKRWLSFTS